MSTQVYAFPRPLPNAAFPPDEALRVIERHAGMTLRDWFAGKAIGSVVATCQHDERYGMAQADYFAGRAYEIADAMLKARAAC